MGYGPKQLVRNAHEPQWSQTMVPNGPWSQTPMLSPNGGSNGGPKQCSMVETMVPDGGPKPWSQTPMLPNAHDPQTVGPKHPWSQTAGPPTQIVGPSTHCQTVVPNARVRFETVVPNTHGPKRYSQTAGRWSQIFMVLNSGRKTHDPHTWSQTPMVPNKPPWSQTAGPNTYASGPKHPWSQKRVAFLH